MSQTPDMGPTPDATPTEALQLADQQPVAVAPPVAAPAAASGHSHTRTILEVIGGVVAAGMILIAGVVGFAVGHATGSDGDGLRGARFAEFRADAQGGQPFGGRGGQQDQQGRGMMPGQDPRGIDPDGDNWTGGGRDGGQGMMPGQDDDGLGMMPGQDDDGLPELPDLPQPTAPQQG